MQSMFGGGTGYTDPESSTVLFTNPFNQDLSGWCVTKITSEPSTFSTSCPLSQNNKPKWGTCP